MACRSSPRAWADATGDLVSDPRSWLLGIVGLALFVGGVVASRSALALTLVVLGVGLFTLGVLLPLVTDAEIGPGGIKLRKAIRDWDGEFRPFIEAEHQSLCRFAALLSQAPQPQVEVFVEDALARAYARRTGVTSRSLSTYVLCTLVQIILGAKRLQMIEDGSRPPRTDNWLDVQAPQLRGIASIALEPRAILLLRHLQGLPVGEIAALLDQPARTVETTLRRAETELAQLDGGP